MGANQYPVDVSPQLYVELAMNSRFGTKRFVPDNCYGTHSGNRLDPDRVYFIRNR